MFDFDPNGRVLAITGPTAVGKTDTAVALAEHVPMHLISMDSALVYRGMDIGTARPDAELLQQHPHALLDIRDPSQTYSAAEFVVDADREVRWAWAHSRLPVLVGGTMLYLRAFRDGLANLPPADAQVRAEIVRQADKEGWPALHAQLARIDPQAAASIHPQNTQRLQRALEVHRLTGEPISGFWREQQATSVSSRLGARLAVVALIPDSRPALHQRIMQRFRGMLEHGLIDEVRGLRERGDLHLGLPSMRSVGYRQTWEHLDGRFDYEELAERGAAATRQLAKRQLTWLRGWDWAQAFAPDDGQGVRAVIDALVRAS